MSSWTKRYQFICGYSSTTSYVPFWSVQEPKRISFPWATCPTKSDSTGDHSTFSEMLILLQLASNGFNALVSPRGPRGFGSVLYHLIVDEAGDAQFLTATGCEFRDRTLLLRSPGSPGSDDLCDLDQSARDRRGCDVGEWSAQKRA